MFSDNTRAGMPATPSSNGHNHPPQPPDQTGDLRRLWHTLIERMWIIILCVVLSIALGAAYLNRAVIVYSATATIQVQQDQTPMFADNVRTENLQAIDFLQTVAQSIKTRPLLERVVRSNKLEQNPRFYNASNAPVEIGDLAGRLEKLTEVKLRRGTRLIDITVQHSDPKLTALLANSLVNEFMSENTELHVSNTSTANEALLKEAEKLRAKLQQSENALQTYMEKSKSISLDQRQDTVIAELKELSTRVTEAKSATIKLESDYNQIVSLGSNVDALMTLPAIAQIQTVSTAKANVSKAESDFAALRQRYKAKHPKYIQAQTQIAALGADLRDNVLKGAQTVKAGLDAARASQAALENALKTQEASALDLNKLSIQYGVLSREVESDRALYDSVLKTMKETSVNKEMKPAKLRVVQPAYTPDAPFSPKRAKIMALSLLAGIFLGLGIVMCLGYLDSSIKTVDEAESLLRLPALAAVSQIKEVKKTKHPLVVAEKSHSAGAEAFRTLRTNLSMLGKEQDRRVFLFTSAMPQEGKTFTSLNFAASLAQTGLKTIVIDGDLRRPTVESTLMGKDIESFGVTDYLTGKKEFSEVVQSTSLPNLFFVSGGTTAPNPAELLSKDGLSEVIQRALKEYDRVVLDTAPILAVSDTLLMLKSVQTVCLVVRAARTSSRSVLRCVQLLRAGGAPLSGVILNRMPRHRGLGYGRYQYYSYYDYGYHGKYSKKGVYGEGESKRKTKSRAVTPEAKDETLTIRR